MSLSIALPEAAVKESKDRVRSAIDQVPKQALLNYEFIGELALSGELRGVNKSYLN